MGDFNVDLLKYEDDTNTADFLDKIYSTSLIPQITSPTRITPRSKTLIDNIFSTDASVETLSGNIVTNISDHLAQFLSFPVKQTPHKKKKEIYKRQYKNFNAGQFIMDLRKINWQEALEINRKETNASFTKFFDIFELLLDSHAPLKKLSCSEAKFYLKPWITPGIQKSMKVKDRLHKKFLRAKDPIRKDALHNEVKQYRNYINILTRNSKVNHYQKFFQDHKKNLHKTWEGIKMIININKTTKKEVNCLDINGNEEVDPAVLSQTFNEFFSTIAQKIESKLINTTKHYTDYLTEPTTNTFILTPTNTEEIEDIIKTLNIRKSIGPNSIPTKLLKQFSKEISIPIEKLINLSFETGLFPDALKLTRIIPVFKNGDSLQCNNYRPISLTSNISKIMEKLAHQRLYLFLENNNVLYDKQFGFRNKHSPNHALIEITEKIREALDKRQFVCGIFVDLQKAFDTVNHDILLDKLNYYGIKGIPNMWFETFLKERYQYTTIKEYSSDQLMSTHGVPQGSVLGPLLFLIFINDLHKAIIHSSVHHFADDTNLLLGEKSLKKINKLVNSDLKALCQWIRSNKLSLNTGKTEIIVFKNKKQKITKHLNFRISGQKIIPTRTVKYLGVFLNDSLSWDTHLNTLILKLNRAIGLLAKIRHYTPKYLLKTIYYSLFNSHLIYASQIWGQSKSDHFRKLVKLQEKALRIINFLPDATPLRDIYMNLKVLKLPDYIALQNTLLIKDFFNEDLPKPLKEHFKKLNDQHRHATRSSAYNSIFVPKVHTETYGKNSIKYQSTKLWNDLQQISQMDLLQQTRADTKKLVSEHFFNSY